MILRYLPLAVAGFVAAVAASGQTRSQGTTYAAIEAPPGFHAAIARGDLVIFEDGDIRGWYWVEVPKR